MKRRIVIDANILIRAVFGIRVRNLMDKYCADTAFYAAEANVEEAMRYVPQLAKKRGVDESLWREALETLMTMIQIVPLDELAAVKSDAIARIVRRDPDDWPAVAAAMLLDCPIWTEDNDFFGAGIATWTSDTVSIYLSGAH